MPNFVPSPPTDSLYKFVAIAGLLLVGASAYFYFDRAEELTRASIALEDKLSWQTLKVNRLLPTIKLRIGPDEAWTFEKRRFGSKRVSPGSREQELDSLIKAFVQLESDIEKRSDLTAKEKKNALIAMRVYEDDTYKYTLDIYSHEEEVVAASSLTRIASIGVVTGIALSGFGFYWWHRKVQRLLDIQLAKTVELLPPPSAAAKVSGSATSDTSTPPLHPPTDP